MDKSGLTVVEQYNPIEPFDVKVPPEESVYDVLAQVTGTDKDIMSDFMSLVPKKEVVSSDSFMSLVPKKESVSPDSFSSIVPKATPPSDPYAKKSWTSRLYDIGTGFHEAAKAEGAAGRMAVATVGGMVAAPVAGIAAIGARIPDLGKAPVDRPKDPLAESNKVFESIAGFPSKILKTPEEEYILDKTVGTAMKPFQMAGEGLKEIVRQTPLKDTIAEPIAGTIGEASALFGFGGAPKRILKTPTLRERIVPTKIDPVVLRDKLISEGVDPQIAVAAAKIVEKRGLTALMEERKIVSADRPYVAKFKENQGIFPAEEPVIKNLPAVNRGFTVGEEPVTPRNPDVRTYTPGKLEAPEVTPRPMTPGDRIALPPGEGFITDKPFETAPLTRTSPFADTGRKLLTEEKGFELVNPPVDTTPVLNWQKKPFKTETSAEKAALKAGLEAKSFEVVPVDFNDLTKGYAYKRVQPEVSNVDTMTDVAKKAADEAGVMFLRPGTFDGKPVLLYEDPLTKSSFIPQEGESLTTAVERVRKPFIDSGELDPKIVADHNADLVKSPEPDKVDRRRIPRKKVSEMTTEEIQKELDAVLDRSETDTALTGLKNKVGYQAVTRQPVQVVMDLDGLKTMNNKFGYAGGDAFLKNFGEAVESTGVEDTFHFTGDEFVVEVKTIADAKKAVAAIDKYIDSNPLTLTDKEGKQHTIKTKYSYGIGKNTDLNSTEFSTEAETNLKTHKATREASGEAAERGAAFKPETEKYVHPTAVKATPEMKAIAKAIGYKGRKFRQGGTLPTQLDSYWTEGTKDTYHFYNTADGRLFKLPTNHPFFEAGAARKLSALPEGVILAKHTIFQGKDIGITFWEGTQEAPKPAKPVVGEDKRGSLIDQEKITAGVDLTTTKARLLKDAGRRASSITEKVPPATNEAKGRVFEDVQEAVRQLNTFVDDTPTETPTKKTFGPGTGEGGAISIVGSSLQKPGFYSKLGEVVSVKMSGRMEVEQLKKMLENNGVSKAEIESIVGTLIYHTVKDKSGNVVYTGTKEGVDALLNTWYDKKADLKVENSTITKQQVLDELEVSGVKFEDVVLGEKKSIPFDGWTEKEIRDHYDTLFGERSSEGHTLYEVKRGITEAESEFTSDPVVDPLSTKFASYQEPDYIPGSYREVFVTAPTSSEQYIRSSGLEGPKDVIKQYLEGKITYEEGAARGLRNDLRADYGKFTRWSDGHSAYSDIQNPIVRIRYNDRIIGATETKKVPLDITEQLFKDGKIDSKEYYTRVANSNPIMGAQDIPSKGGKKILFIEEMQGPGGDTKWRVAGDRLEYFNTKKAADDYAAKNNIESRWITKDIEGEQGKMPSALQSRIYDIGVKRVLALAKEGGYDGVAWTTGEMQASRYDLSKHLDAITVSREKGGLEIRGWKDKKQLIHETGISEEKLADYVGKDKVGNVIDQLNTPDLMGTKDVAELTGLDLKIGGEGLKSVYDKTLPEKFKKYGKEEVGNIDIVSSKSLGEFPEDSGGKSVTVPFIPITSKTPSSYTLYSGLDPIGMAKAIRDTGKDIKSGVYLLGKLGEKVYEGGKTKYFEWQREIKSLLGDMWEKFKKYISEVWDRLQSGKIGPLKNQRGSIDLGIKRTLKDIAKLSDEYLGEVSTRLANIAPPLKSRLRKFEYAVASKSTAYTDRVMPLVSGSTKMNVPDKKAFDLARKNGDAPELKRLVTKYNLGDAYHEQRLVLTDLLKDARDAGYKVNRVPNYHPREVIDPVGLLDYLQKGDGWSIFEYAIKEKERSLGRFLELNEKIKVVNTLLRGYSTENITLSKPGQLKARGVQLITPEIDKFYADSNSALLRYINDITTAVEARKLFGVVKDKDAFNFDETIGSFVLDALAGKKITHSQERELTNILKARFNAVGTRGAVTTYKNLAYADTMGSPISAITQLGDIAWALYENGLPRTIAGLAQSIAGKSIATKKDLGIEKIAAEFSDRSLSAKIVDQIFMYTGLTGIDAIGKEALINSSYKKAVQRASTPTTREAFKKELQPIFEGETNLVLKDFENGTVSDNVKLYLFNKLADFQPIALSEMPEKYLSGGNGRIFYMLKTFTLKMFDVFRTQAFQKIATKGTRIEGIKNLLKLSAYLMLANASADVIQEFILGRPLTIPDLVVDNIWKLFGSSRYTGQRIAKEGAGTGLVKQILPPFKLIDALTKDVTSFGDEKGFESAQSIPLFGKLYYYWFGKGKEKIEKKEAQANKPIKLNSLRNLPNRPKLERPRRPY